MTGLLTELRGKLTPRHLLWLDKMCEKDYFKETREELIALAFKGKVQLWGFCFDDGIIITQILVHNCGKELCVYGMAGEGIFHDAKKVYAELKEIAKTHGCTLIGALSQEPLADGLYENLGCKLIGKRFITEI